MSIHYLDEDLNVCGPVTPQELLQWYDAAMISAETHVSDADVEQGEWVPLPEWAEQVRQSVTQVPGAATSLPAEDEWYYLDDDNEIQGPYASGTLVGWVKAGALGLQRLVSVAGSEWHELSSSDLATGLDELDGGVVCGPGDESGEEDEEVQVLYVAPQRGGAGAKAGGRAVVRRASMRSAARRLSTSAQAEGNANAVRAAAVRCHRRRSTQAQQDMSEMAQSLRKARDNLRKDPTPRRTPRRTHARQPSTNLSALKKGLKMRRTFILRGKRESLGIGGLHGGNQATFRMADGGAVPEAAASFGHMRGGSTLSEFDFSEDDDDDDSWLD